MDKIFYWLQDRVEQGEFRVFWVQGKQKLADYFTKYHSAATHRQLRSIYIYIYIKSKSPTRVQDCIELLTKDKPSTRPYSNSKTTKPGDRTNPIINSQITSQPTTYCLLDKLTKALKDKLVNRRLVQTHKLFRTTELITPLLSSSQSTG